MSSASSGVSTTMPIADKLYWELVESEAYEKYYINDAPEPGILILHKNHFLSDGKFTLLLNHVGIISQTKTEKEIQEKLLELLNKATIHIKVFKISKIGRYKGKKVLFWEGGPCQNTNTS